MSYFPTVTQGGAGADPWLVIGAVTTPGLTDAELRANPVPVDASGSIVAAVGPLTDAELRATPVPVDASGSTVPVSGPLTNAELRASVVPVLATYPRAYQDAFGRFRVSNPQTLFDSKQIFNNQPLAWDDAQTSGGGTSSTFNTNQASTTLAVSAATAGTRVRQTFLRWPYQPGKSQQFMATGILGAPATGITRRIGLFDSGNGIFFESGPTDIKVVIRTSTSGSPVDTGVAQTAWNIDKLDGSGPSGVTADWSKTQILGAFFEWLGVGSTWFFVVMNGEIVLVHRVDNANVIALVYMSTPNLPMRYEISNGGTGGVASLVHICSTVISEGGRSSLGTTFSVNRAATGMQTNNDANIYPLIAIRLGSTTAYVELINIGVVCASNSAFNWMLILNPTVTGTAFSFSAVTNSAVEVDVARTNATTLTVGTTLAGGTLLQTNEGGSIAIPPTDFRVGKTIAGVSDIVVLAVQRITGTSETFYGTLTWREAA